jgi:L-fuculose-phosphate aldolase
MRTTAHPGDERTAELASAVADACRILEHQGHGHSFLGHVSARLPAADGFVVKPAGLGLGEVSAADVLHCGLDGSLRSPEGRLHSEMPIHTSILRARSDVGAVVHTHPRAAAGLLASTADFALVNQDSVHFVDQLGWYEDPRLVDTAELGDALAAALAENRAVLLRNHGIVTVGTSVAEAVFFAVSLVNSLRVQAAARSFGDLRELSHGQAREMSRHFSDGIERRVAGTWEYLVRLAGVGTHVEQEEQS